MRRSTHGWVGAIAAAGIELLDCRFNWKEVDWWRVLASAGVGALAAAAPDVLEPALHPNHRSICHSMAAGGAVSYGLAKLDPGSAGGEWQYSLVRAAVVGYLSHLLLDATTPKGLPVLT